MACRVRGVGRVSRARLARRRSGARVAPPPCAAKGGNKAAQPAVEAAPQAAPPPAYQTPLLVGAAAVAGAFLFSKLRGARGSVGDLEARGMLDENRDVDEEKFYKRMMAGVNTIEMEELTDEQIAAARARRAQARSMTPAEIEQELRALEVPQNHPWAQKVKLTAAEEAARTKRIMEANAPRRRRRGEGPPPSS